VRSFRCGFFFLTFLGGWLLQPCNTPRRACTAYNHPDTWNKPGLLATQLFHNWIKSFNSIQIKAPRLRLEADGEMQFKGRRKTHIIEITLKIRAAKTNPRTGYRASMPVTAVRWLWMDSHPLVKVSTAAQSPPQLRPRLPVCCWGTFNTFHAFNTPNQGAILTHMGVL